jgi:aspartate oxidase
MTGMVPKKVCGVGGILRIAAGRASCSATDPRMERLTRDVVARSGA